jgi:HTH-type transcriptional regulator / antitoxin HipB
VRVTNARDLGLYVRDRRQAKGWTQAELAVAANVSRRWLAALEAGKGTAQVGLVFQTLEALGLVSDIQRADAGPGQIDLDELLGTYGSERGESR